MRDVFALYLHGRKKRVLHGSPQLPTALYGLCTALVRLWYGFAPEHVGALHGFPWTVYGFAQGEAGRSKQDVRSYVTLFYLGSRVQRHVLRFSADAGCLVLI